MIFLDENKKWSFGNIRDKNQIYGLEDTKRRRFVEKIIKVLILE